MKIKHDKEHFLSCNVAAFTYCEGVEVFSQLKVGKKVRLVREDENPHDHKAVAIFFGDTHIGYIPRQQNETIAKLLDLGYDDIFEARIQAVDPTAHPEQQVDIVIYIKRKEK
jgi:hypothetical protein